MTSAEHSTLVFLLLAIEAAPTKTPNLLTLAERRIGSSEFREALEALRSVESDQEALLERSHLMRQKLRQS